MNKLYQYPKGKAFMTSPEVKVAVTTRCSQRARCIGRGC
ncbi:hypothetical protein MM1S1540310_2002 [Mycobacteroides abscessus subsp. bolletii 1S-154-0310]|uniref:Uncharacterized protein n=1 Tax=Mycobacteroides abscessus MAB_091912_2446 TaxID=1335414 RepID=A0A829MF28_9MYCO|nr:hypothetical protein MM1S1510930_2443 [Mycobacteroides abscessus subsp. bolletii 1S-151-0930]EIU67077.1 hypothetical protein MM1S1520914_2649 [Mycobacteroides abscessus subsp. bolletii 1S-152-0914]EIU75015.1 hypothetical protein MM1S1530915_1990 [Mycobacteroides abscessus subsp. bolletii 1S-153-0915]EIU79872.1 hypothetical protein MM1S1540310_2002 [Mycobacteroides abscessus subsp. bolletii 1S-154-0310]EIV11561.1 hypothetical protein MM2B0912R_2757 [Mycobacteroides abscessus subsp. bolletii 2